MVISYGRGPSGALALVDDAPLAMSASICAVGTQAAALACRRARHTARARDVEESPRDQAGFAFRGQRAHMRGQIIVRGGRCTRESADQTCDPAVDETGALTVDDRR